MQGRAADLTGASSDVAAQRRGAASDEIMSGSRKQEEQVAEHDDNEGLKKQTGGTNAFVLKVFSHWLPDEVEEQEEVRNVRLQNIENENQVMVSFL